MTKNMKDTKEMFVFSLPFSSFCFTYRYIIFRLLEVFNNVRKTASVY